MTSSSFNLGVSGIDNTHPNSTLYHLGVSGIGETHPNSLSHHLGVRDPGLSPDAYFGISSAAKLSQGLQPHDSLTLTDFLHRPEPKPEKYIGDLYVDIAATVVPAAKVIKTTAKIGHGLHELSKEHDTSPTLEDTACKAAKVATGAVVKTVGTGVIVGGVPLLLAEAIATPPMLLAVPVAAAALPQAYANMRAFSEFAAEKAEQDCHTMFRNFGDK